MNRIKTKYVSNNADKSSGVFLQKDPNNKVEEDANTMTIYEIPKNQLEFITNQLPAITEMAGNFKKELDLERDKRQFIEEIYNKEKHEKIDYKNKYEAVQNQLDSINSKKQKINGMAQYNVDYLKLLLSDEKKNEIDEWRKTELQKYKDSFK